MQFFCIYIYFFLLRLFPTLLNPVFSFSKSTFMGLCQTCLYQRKLILLDCFVFTILTLLSLLIPFVPFHSSWSWMLLFSILFFWPIWFNICSSALSTVIFWTIKTVEISAASVFFCYPSFHHFHHSCKIHLPFQPFSCFSCNSVLNFPDHLSIHFVIPTPQILLLTLTMRLCQKCCLKSKQHSHVQGKSSDTC